MPKGKTVGLIFIEGFADWEFGLLSAAIGGGEEWFDGRVIALSATDHGAPIDRGSVAHPRAQHEA